METREILSRVKSGEISVEEAERYFKREPYEELGYAKLDLHREIRSGFQSWDSLNLRCLADPVGSQRRLRGSEDETPPDFLFPAIPRSHKPNAVRLAKPMRSRRSSIRNERSEGGRSYL